MIGYGSTFCEEGPRLSWVHVTLFKICLHLIQLLNDIIATPQPAKQNIKRLDVRITPFFYRYMAREPEKSLIAQISFIFIQ